MNQYDALLLQNHLSFSMYACSREMIKRCRAGLDALGLTYTQYIVMLVIWDEGTTSVRDLGRRLYLDSGTLTPVLKTLEQQQLITRERSKQDERVLLVTATAKGVALREEALAQQPDMALNTGLSAEEEAQLAALLGKMLAHEQK
jgi:DNA-binding MarR family transcriptional regulator